MISDEVLKKLAKVDKEPIYHVETSITELAEMATELLQRRDADRWIPVTDANNPPGLVLYSPGGRVGRVTGCYEREDVEVIA